MPTRTQDEVVTEPLDAAEIKHDYKLTRPWLSRDLVTLLLGGIILAIAAGTILYLADLAAAGASAQAATLAFTGAALVLAFVQWRNAVDERSFDTLYGRLELVNKQLLETWQLERALARESDDPTWEDNSEMPFRYYVFTELDTLEVAIEK